MFVPWLAELLHSAFTPARAASRYRPRIDGLEERLVPAFDLQLYNTVSSGLVAPGNYVTCNVTLVKQGDETVTLAVVQDTLPAGVEFVGVSATRGSASFHAPSNQVRWTVGELVDPGTMETLSITVRVTGPGVLSNTALVFSPSQAEFDTSNNVSTAVIQVTDPNPPPPPPTPPSPPAEPPEPPIEVIQTPPVFGERFVIKGPLRIRRARFRGRAAPRPGFHGVPVAPVHFQFRHLAF